MNSYCRLVKLYKMFGNMRDELVTFLNGILKKFKYHFCLLKYYYYLLFLGERSKFINI